MHLDEPKKEIFDIYILATCEFAAKGSPANCYNLSSLEGNPIHTGGKSPIPFVELLVFWVFSCTP